MSPDWEERVAAVWQIADSLPEAELVMRIDALADECPADDAKALFERASARDRVGLEAEAEHYYRAALAADGLDAYRRARIAIQLGSTLRILGQLAESERLLTELLDSHMAPGHPRALHNEARAFLALTYAAQGRHREAAGLALCTLSPYLSRYNRSLTGNASEMVEKHWD